LEAEKLRKITKPRKEIRSTSREGAIHPLTVVNGALIEKLSTSQERTGGVKETAVKILKDAWRKGKARACALPCSSLASRVSVENDRRATGGEVLLL